MKKLKGSFMALLVIVTLICFVNYGYVGKETKAEAYSINDTIFASGMDLLFVHPYYQYYNIVEKNDTTKPYAQVLLDLSVYENTGFVKPVTIPYSGPELTWGRYGKALDFDGSDDYINILHSDSFDFSPREATISMWINPSETYEHGRPSQWYYFMTQPSTFEIGWQGWDDLLEFKVFNSTGGTYSVTYDMNLTASTWYYFSFVVDYPSGDMYIYLNGEEVSENLAAVANWRTTSNDIHISDSSYGIHAIIDEVRIYPFALEETHIKNDLRTPMNQFRTYGFYEALNFTGGSTPTPVEWRTGDFSGVTGFNENNPNLPFVERPKTENYGYRKTFLKYVAGFQKYRMYATVNETNCGTYGAWAGVIWSFTFFKNGISQRTFSVELHAGQNTWEVRFWSNGDSMKVLPFWNNTRPFRIIVDAWIGEDNKHFSIRASTQEPVSQGDNSLLYSYDLKDRNNNTRRVEWFDGWVLQSLSVSHYLPDLYPNNGARFEIVEHGMIFIAAAVILVIGIVASYLAYEYVVAPVLQETTGIPMPSIIEPNATVTNATTLWVDITHELGSIFYSVGQTIVEALAPIVTAIANVAAPFIQTLINFLSDILTALINIASGLWNIIVSAVDGLLYAIFPGLGPTAFSSFISGVTDFFVGLFTWIIASFGYLVTMLTSFFSMFTAVMGKFLNIVSTAITNWVSIIQNIFSMISGGFGQTYNIFVDLNLSTWIIIIAILYPIYLLTIWDDKGIDGVISHLNMIMNIFAWILNILITVVQTFINIISSVIEALPGE